MKKIETVFSRSNHIESSHRVKLYVTNIEGKVLLSTNDENDFIYPRSAIKIFQAIPFVKSNAVKYFNLNSKILALSASSHRGEKFHINELNRWLSKIGVKKKALKCGIHNPLNPKATEDLLRLNIISDEIYNNCAGKHLAMITSCIINRQSIKTYLKFDHPHQIAIRQIFEKFSNIKIRKKDYGIDGCSAPQYAFRIKDISNMLINLLKSYQGNFEYSYEVKKLISSITKNPKYIGGSDSLDSRIMKISNKKIFCKGGAEGVFLFINLKKNIVGVVKIVDGNERATPSVIYNLFKKYNIMSNTELRELKKIYDFNIINHANLKIGSIETKL